MSEWKPIESAPKDGRWVPMRISPRLGTFHARWTGHEWQPLEYQHGMPHQTEWLHEPPTEGVGGGGLNGARLPLAAG
jgi:hypothetical protein